MACQCVIDKLVKTVVGKPFVLAITAESTRNSYEEETISGCL